MQMLNRHSKPRSAENFSQSDVLRDAQRTRITTLHMDTFKFCRHSTARGQYLTAGCQVLTSGCRVSTKFECVHMKGGDPCSLGVTQHITLRKIFGAARLRMPVEHLHCRSASLPSHSITSRLPPEGRGSDRELDDELEAHMG